MQGSTPVSSSNFKNTFRDISNLPRTTQDEKRSSAASKIRGGAVSDENCPYHDNYITSESVDITNSYGTTSKSRSNSLSVYHGDEIPGTQSTECAYADTDKNGANVKNIDNQIQQIVRNSKIVELAIVDVRRGDFANAEKKLLPIAEGGFLKAQYYLGKIYEVGNAEIKQDLSKAQMWYERAVSKNYLPACSSLCIIYFNSNFPQHNYARAMELFHHALMRGDDSAYIEILNLACDELEQGKYVDALGKIDLLKQAGDNSAKLMDAVLHANNITNRNKMLLVQTLIPIVRSGDIGLMCVFTGYLFLKGCIGEQDLNLAQQLFNTAIKNGVTGANTFIAHMYENGLYFERDVREARKYSQKAWLAGAALNAEPNLASIREMTLQRR